ncbi:MAG: helix-turn-helix domain-containing protein [Gallionella sp.]|nr:helix-turn-helix domain-containing protein [Gallionella sp.]
MYKKQGLNIKRIREHAHVSQPVFARYLNTSESTVQKWETGQKRPSGMALRLLHCTSLKSMVLKCLCEFLISPMRTVFISGCDSSNRDPLCRNSIYADDDCHVHSVRFRMSLLL